MYLFLVLKNVVHVMPGVRSNDQNLTQIKKGISNYQVLLYKSLAEVKAQTKTV